MFIINAIKKIIKSKRIMFTTPTHLGSGIIPNGLKTLIGYKAFCADVSEIEGLDNLKNPQNCIKKSQEYATKIYDTKKTFYLTNGSSAGILASMLTCLNANDKVLIARNVHESVFNGLVLTGAIPIWFLPEYDKEFDIAKGITLNKIKEEYSFNPDIKALIITSPTYEGICSEIEAIAKFCRSKNIIFIVDEAHGALFSFSNKFPKRAINLGADISVQSLHKNTPALTGAALLHIGKNSNIDIEKIQQNLNLITSTSPSWLLIASIEGAVNFLNSKRFQSEIDELLMNIQKLKNENPNYNFLNNDDKTKLLIAKKNCTGEALSDFLFKNNIEDELVTKKAVLCLCGIGTTKKKMKKLSKTLSKKSITCKENNLLEKENFVLNIPKMAMLPQKAIKSNYEIIDSKNAIGKIIAENITPYPPCISLLMAGEVIEKEHLQFLNEKVKVCKK